MSSGKQLSALLLLSTALTFPAAALAQSTGAEGPPPTEEEVPDETQAQEVDPANDSVPGEIADSDQATPDISIPGGTIVVTGRRYHS